ncbi:MAG: homoserine kinase [Armatimonadetes bacterium]|nr:MAG: homoserine kinase [Armatimonadota bacterium]
MIGSASAPASSGNLGPGFDVLALALQLRCTATVEPASRMTLTERNRTSRLNPDNMIYRAVAGAVDQPMHVTLHNEIPRSRGLGSSSAVTASVAGAAFKVVGIRDARQRVFEIVTEIEGHADNAAAAVFGGFVAATPMGIQRLDLHESLHPVVGIPDVHLRTSDAREALPTEMSREVVVRSLSRLAFLIEGLANGNAETLRHASGDELHEAPRAGLSPVTGELMDAARAAGAVHACWSGAGPSALAFATADSKGRVIGAMAGVLGTDGEVLALPVDTKGLI